MGTWSSWHLDMLSFWSVNSAPEKASGLKRSRLRHRSIVSSVGASPVHHLLHRVPKRRQGRETEDVEEVDGDAVLVDGEGGCVDGGEAGVGSGEGLDGLRQVHRVRPPQALDREHPPRQRPQPCTWGFAK